jgi:hypothetical protein
MRNIGCDMGKKSRLSGETSVEQYRRRLGQHEKHPLLGRHKEKAYRAKDVSVAKSSKPLQTIVLFVVAVLCVALLAYFAITYQLLPRLLTSPSHDAHSTH